MRRILSIAAVLVCALGAYAPRAEAQTCGARCESIRDLTTGQHIGYGCVTDLTEPSKCTATGTTCTLQMCGGSLALIVDSKGTALAAAQLCSGQVREVRHIGVTRLEPRANPESAVRTASAVRWRRSWGGRPLSEAE